MITLWQKEALPYMVSASFMQTACLISAFEGSALAAEVWVQRVCGRITAVISRQGGRLNISADNADFEELREFISVIGFTEIFCERDTAMRLGLRTDPYFTVLKKKTAKKADFCETPPLKELYSALKWGEDGEISLPCFESFATDVSHRLRHFGAAAVLEEYGAALCFKCSFGGIISGIAVNKENRGKGLGSELLKKLCAYLDGEIFVCTTKQLAEFYKKHGFSECDTAVLVRGSNERIF